MRARVSAILLMTVSFLSALATNRALLVGIGAYDSKKTGWEQLHGDNDVALLDAVKRRLGAKGELFVAIDACYSHGIEKDEVTDLDPELLRYMRGTDHVFIPPAGSSYLKKLPMPKRFFRGARMTVVTACRENERNLEYKAPTGKLYGSLSYYISTLLKSNADFNRWIRCFKDQDYARLNIIQSVQHPSIEIYP